MSALQDKYRQLITTAQQSGISNLQIREEGNILYINGTAPNEDAKKQIWNVYSSLNPGFKSADVVLDIDAGTEYTVQKGDTLSEIGQKHGVGWKEIYEANKDQIKDPDMIQRGWKLKIPQK